MATLRSSGSTEAKALHSGLPPGVIGRFLVGAQCQDMSPWVTFWVGVVASEGEQVGVSRYRW
ncbi:MAG: hypothetical protein ACRDTH_07555 [Pseudonocardiaceae bacterium]